MQNVCIIALFCPKFAKTSPLWEQRERRITVVWRRLRHGINFIFSKEFKFFKIIAFWAFWRPNTCIDTYRYSLVLGIPQYPIYTRICPIPWMCPRAGKTVFRLFPHTELLKPVRIHQCANPCARVCSDSTYDRRCVSLYIWHSSTTNEILIDFFKKVDFFEKLRWLWHQREQRIRVVFRR